MTREELEHAIRAACDLGDDDEVWIFGSQAILGQYPDAPPDVRQSAEADIALKNHPERTDALNGPLGELSTFHQSHGFYVHGVPIESAFLPAGWNDRTVEVNNENTNGFSGWCVEGHDLAASKLAAFRDKDLAFVRVLLKEHMIHVDRLQELVKLLPVASELRERIALWITYTVKDLWPSETAK
jgi:hypothetical protein